MRWVGLGAILILLMLAVGPAAAEDPTALVYADPAVLELAAGQTGTLQVILDGAEDVYGIDVSAAFDPLLVEVLDADPATEGVQVLPGDFPLPDFIARNEVDNQAGVLRYAVSEVSPSEPANGSGYVFTVQLRARSASGEGSFAITAVELTDRDGILLPVQPESALIRVAAGSSGAPTAEPTATPTPIPTATPTPIPTAANPPAVTPPAAATPAAANPPAAPPPAAATPAVASPPASSLASPMPIPAVPAAAAAAPSLEPTRAAAQQPVDPAQAAAPAQPAVAASAGPDAANLAAPPVTPQAVAAAPAAESAALDAAPEALAPAAPAAAQPNAMDALPQRLPQSREAGDQRPPAFDPSNLLLIVGIFAFMAAAVLGVSLVVILRR